MEKLNISKAIAYGNFAFSHAEMAEAVYVQLAYSHRFWPANVLPHLRIKLLGNRCLN